MIARSILLLCLGTSSLFPLFPGSLFAEPVEDPPPLASSLESAGYRALTWAIDEATGTWLVDAHVNDRPARFAIDTGAFTIALLDIAAPILGFTVEPTPHHTVTLQGSRPMFSATIDHIGTPAFRLPTQTLPVVIHTSLERQIPPRFHGVFGARLLNQLHAILDPPTRQLWIHETGEPTVLSTWATASGWSVHALDTLPDSHLTGLTVRIGDHLAWFAIDTGTAPLVIDDALAAQLNLSKTAPTLDSLSLGTYSAAPQPVLVRDLSAMVPLDSEHRVGGLIGNQWLTATRAIIDWDGKRMYLSPHDPAD